MAILVTGGAGFIGSVTVEQLRAAGEAVVVLDNLSRGHRAAVDPSIPFYEGDISDGALVDKACTENDIEACIHFAAYAYPGESVEFPALYYDNNLRKSICLLESLRKNNVRKVVFSSTCAAFGEPEYLPIDEKHPQRPPSPYGWSKMVFERVLESYDAAYGYRFVALRYFNACGATPSRGEHHDPEPHLLPIILKVAQGELASLKIFGEDYPTPDGTCIRDYIHVSDLADAHLRALKYLRDGGTSQIFNLGNGTGFSVKECVAAVEKITGKTVTVESAERRPGDASHLVADASKAKEILGWVPQKPSIETILQDAWDWFTAHPDGYGD